MIPESWFRERKIYFDFERNIIFSSEEPSSSLQDELRLFFGSVPEFEIVTENEIKEMYGTNGGSISPRKKPDNGDNPAAIDTVFFIDRLIEMAVEENSSDIHIEPGEKEVRVRFRRYGFLSEKLRYPLARHRQTIARLKIMANLDIAETRRPQDGNIRQSKKGRTIDIRLSLMRTRYGEKAVMRILDKERLRLDLDTLGFRPDQLKLIRAAINKKHGLILCTGPTGSGKTTTLYSMLRELNSPDINILTIEDPIEYELEGINQSRVNPAIGLTFARALRAFLRQDPDIIMVGEIRDEETTAIALRAAMTGHLVISTLHTNTPEGARQRLIDLEGSPFLIDDTLLLVIGQRLIPVYENGKPVGRKMKAKLYLP